VTEPRRAVSPVMKQSIATRVSTAAEMLVSPAPDDHYAGIPEMNPDLV
jgi:hypothetical protein